MSAYIFAEAAQRDFQQMGAECYLSPTALVVLDPTTDMIMSLTRVDRAGGPIRVIDYLLVAKRFK